MVTQTAALLLAVEEEKVTPGALGFLVVALLGVATWLLIRSMHRQLRRIDLPADRGTDEESDERADERPADGPPDRPGGEATDHPDEHRADRPDGDATDRRP